MKFYQTHSTNVIYCIFSKVGLMNIKILFFEVIPHMGTLSVVY